jgi:tRNA (guanosine-2'-O-)-methyltransferase
VLQAEEKFSGGAKQVIPVFEIPFEERIALVFGNEKRGVNDIFVENADIRAFIPMFGFVESFNISVAAAITLFCSSIRGASQIRRTASLSETDSEALKHRWLTQDLREGEKVLEYLNAKEGK